MGVRLIVWRELLDLSRDRKTLLAVFLLPLIGLPGVAFLSGFLATTQSVSIGIIYKDPEARDFALSLADLIERSVSSSGARASLIVTNESLPSGMYDLIVLIPRGFSANVSSLNGVGFVRANAAVGEAGQLALQALYSSLSILSTKISYARIQWLASRAGVEVIPQNVMNPIRVATGYHEVSGAPASPSRVLEVETARLLSFGFLFVIDPAVIYMADSVVGEKERRTIEKLLLSPISRRDILFGKVVASFILGIIASFIDVAGLLLFFYLTGTSVRLSLDLVLLWSASSGLVILLTAFLVGGVSARSSTVRGAQNASFLLLSLAVSVYFSALLVDLTKVSRLVLLFLELIPYTHAALAVNTFVIGDVSAAILHLIILIIFVIISMLFAERSFEAERLVAYTG